MAEKLQMGGKLSRRHVLGGLALTGFLGLPRPVVSDESAGGAATEHKLMPAIRHAKSSLEKAASMTGYECIFSKKEAVGNQMISQTMKMKVRHEPFSVYMFFLDPSKGREVIYVDGKNDNKLQVHETGLASLVGTLSLAPNDSRVMAENRYPITRAGLVRMAESVIEQWEQESQYGECEVKYFQDAKVAEYTCRVIESSHPEPRKQFPYQMTRLWIDERSGLAVRVQQFGFPRQKGAKPPVLEDYTFTEIRPEVRLTDRDFDTRNPNYNY
jgi:hypothetical protein